MFAPDEHLGSFAVLSFCIGSGLELSAGLWLRMGYVDGVSPVLKRATMSRMVTERDRTRAVLSEYLALLEGESSGKRSMEVDGVSPNHSRGSRDSSTLRSPSASRSRSPVRERLVEGCLSHRLRTAKWLIQKWILAT